MPVGKAATCTSDSAHAQNRRSYKTKHPAPLFSFTSEPSRRAPFIDSQGFDGITNSSRRMSRSWPIHTVKMTVRIGNDHDDVFAASNFCPSWLLCRSKLTRRKDSIFSQGSYAACNPYCMSGKSGTINRLRSST